MIISAFFTDWFPRLLVGRVEETAAAEPQAQRHGDDRCAPAHHRLQAGLTPVCIISTIIEAIAVLKNNNIFGFSFKEDFFFFNFIVIIRF